VKLLLLDRYLARRMARPFTAVVAIVMMLLSLENTTRLLGQLENVERPLMVLAKFMSYLLPEYLAISLIFALFIGVALSLRGLALSGEFDIFASVGLSPARMLRIPLIIAVLCAALLLVTRGYLEPWGERKLDAFGSAVRAGELGMAIKAGEFYSPSMHVTFHAEGIDNTHRRFTGVMVRSDKYTAFARTAQTVNGGHNGLLIILQDGQIVTDEESHKPSIVYFKELRLLVSTDGQILAKMPSHRDSSRQFIDQIMSRAMQDGHSEVSLAARSALAARLAAALALPLLPFLAIGLCIPPKRQSGALGIGLGVILLVAFIQGIHAFEDSATATGALTIALIWTGLALVSFWAWRGHILHGPGHVEGLLHRIYQPALERLAKLLAAGTNTPAQMRVSHSGGVISP
jgi:lipopolysaccharide export system permease protein